MSGTPNLNTVLGRKADSGANFLSWAQNEALNTHVYLFFLFHIHNSCFSWFVFHGYVGTGFVESLMKSKIYFYGLIIQEKKNTMTQGLGEAIT